LRIAVIVTLNALTDYEVRTSCEWSRKVSHKTDRKRESRACLVNFLKSRPYCFCHVFLVFHTL